MAFAVPDRHVELDIGNAERDPSEAVGIGLIDAHAIAPGAGGLDVIIVLAEGEGGAFELLCDRGEAVEQGLRGRG